MQGARFTKEPGDGFLPIQCLQAGLGFPVSSANSTGCHPLEHWYPTLQKASFTKMLNLLRNLSVSNHRSAYLFILLWTMRTIYLMVMQRGKELRLLFIFSNCSISKGCVLLLQSPVLSWGLTPNPSDGLVVIKCWVLQTKMSLPSVMWDEHLHKAIYLAGCGPVS